MIRKEVYVGKVGIGGNHPISIQSMTNTKTCDIKSSLSQINELYHAGCEIIRLAVPDLKAAFALEEIVQQSPIPVIADIHFDYKLALQAIKSKVDGLRLNPGNLQSEKEIALIAERAGESNIVIRVGANSGSVDDQLLKQKIQKCGSFESAMAEAMVESVQKECELLEKYHFNNIKVSLKSSSIPVTIAACRKFNQLCDYPQHIGITEAGTIRRGIIKSAVGIGALLMDNIGDTMRVSLSDDPIKEVICAKQILECANLRPAMPELVSCPTCGRTEINLIELANKVENFVDNLKNSGKTINLKKIAIMGCIVNGPGEARDADLGVAGGKNRLAIFKYGKVVGSYDESTAFDVLKQMIIDASN